MKIPETFVVSEKGERENFLPLIKKNIYTLTAKLKYNSTYKFMHKIINIFK